MIETNIPIRLFTIDPCPLTSDAFCPPFRKLFTGIEEFLGQIRQPCARELLYRVVVAWTFVRTVTVKKSIAPLFCDIKGVRG